MGRTVYIYLHEALIFFNGKCILYVPGTWRCPLFWGFNPPKEGPFKLQSKQGAPFGFQVKIYQSCPMDPKNACGKYIYRWWFEIFFIFTPKPGEDSHFDKHIFQMGWHHQPDQHESYVWDVETCHGLKGEKTANKSGCVFWDPGRYKCPLSIMGSQVTGGNWRSKRTLRKRRVKPVKPVGSQLILRVMFFGRVKKHHPLRHAGTTLLALPPPMLLGFWFQVADCWEFDFKWISRHVENMLGKSHHFSPPFGEYVYMFSKHLEPIYKYLEDIN